jgi:hypothetical protein
MEAVDTVSEERIVIDISDESKGSKAWSNRIRKRAKELTNELDTGYMELAKILYDVYDTPVEGQANNPPVFKQWGYQNFGDYAEQELGIHRKKAERLRSIWYILSNLNIDEAIKNRLIALGQSKMRELVRVLDSNNAKAWLELAERTSYVQLRNKITASIENQKKQRLEEQVSRLADTGSDGTPFEDDDGDERTFADEEEAKAAASSLGDDPFGPVRGSDGPKKEGAEGREPTATEIAGALPAQTEDLSFLHFALFPDQHLNVLNALEQAGKLCGSSKKGHQLDLLCTDFLATNDITNDPKGSNKAKYLAKIEKLLGVRLIAVDAKTRDVTYGMETLKTLAGGSN